ncbi:MAG: hypothetical protein COT84_06885 [Chlamydiae bacterium CG10_big_fil_rev_8_21_14_0_10_35_9]|nr:MAG: hypothetical protein COT84_06885 [Chlamydiae bacterium CG10_big_fil_rev_8_21_14_0_10_35_9]
MVIRLITFQLLITLSIFTTELPEGYNAPFPKKPLRGSVGTSFLYWEAIQDGLEYGITNPAGRQTLPNPNGRVLQQDFTYKPGFKIEASIFTSHDNWQIVSQYLRLHQDITSTSSAPNSPIGSIYTLWLISQNAGFASNAAAKWRLNFDQLDLELARSFYVGKELVFNAHFGTRANWIDQRYNIQYFNVFAKTGNAFSSRAVSFSKSDSWALGPKGGINTNWLLGKGFRLIGKASASIVYTKFKTKHTEQSPSNSISQVNIKDDSSYLRPMAELGLGLGWGSFFKKESFFFDLSTSYDFQLLGSQNMMQNLLNLSQGVSGGIGDLYFHGVSATIRFDF